MSKEILSYEVDDAVGVVTIDRPPVNALRYQDLEALTDLLDSLPREDERVIALTTGGDRTFSAGHDVTEFREYDPDAASYRDEVYMNLLETVYDHPLPIVVGVDGPAVGAAAIIASLCDLRVASAGASFAIPEITVGIVGGYGPLRRLLPDGVARHMLYTGNPSRPTGRTIWGWSRNSSKIRASVPSIWLPILRRRVPTPSMRRERSSGSASQRNRSRSTGSSVITSPNSGRYRTRKKPRPRSRGSRSGVRSSRVRTLISTAVRPLIALADRSWLDLRIAFRLYLSTEAVCSCRPVPRRR
ncbi:enoyl-CoA hydratase/isomerase family protein [Saliphagus sp. GCM10025308]